MADLQAGQQFCDFTKIETAVGVIGLTVKVKVRNMVEEVEVKNAAC